MWHTAINCVANVCAAQPSTDSLVFMLGEEEMTPVCSLHFREFPQHVPKSVRTDVNLFELCHCVNCCCYVASEKSALFLRVKT